MSDTSNNDFSSSSEHTDEVVEEKGAYTDEHGTQADVENEIAHDGTTVSGDAFGVPAEGEYTDEHGAEDGHA